MHKDCYVLNDYPIVLAVICPLFRSNNVLSSDQLRQHQNTWSYIFAPKPERLLGNRSYLSACIYFMLYTNEASETLGTYWQCLIDCNTQKKNTGSMIRFCNLASSIEITYMPVAIEPRGFGKHKICHIILQEVRKQSFGSRSSDS